MNYLTFLLWNERLKAHSKHTNGMTYCGFIYFRGYQFSGFHEIWLFRWYLNSWIGLVNKNLWPFVTPGTSFEQTWIFLPQGCSMSNISAFRPVVYEKNILRFIKIFLVLPLIGPSPIIWTNLNPHPYPCFPPSVKLAKWFLRRSCSKEKVNRRTDGQTDARQIAMFRSNL